MIQPLSECDVIQPLSECDVIMKGGITSGIVYPKAILALSEVYRFRGVGGNSAGSIGAVLTAAAEYGRRTEAPAPAGFSVLAAIPDQMQRHLADLFQPAPEARHAFAVFKALGLERKPWKALLMVVALEWWGALIGALLALLPALVVGGWAWLAAAPAALILAPLGAGVVGLARLLRILHALNYGLCPGSRDSAGQGGFPPLSDWLEQTIAQAAGHDASQRPLLFGDLIQGGPQGHGTADEPDIDLRTVTTNLNMRRPHTLPWLGDRNYYFDPVEFRAILPASVVHWMVAVGEKRLEATRQRDGAAYITPAFDGRPLIPFPDPADLPVVVAARMSLSFPFLISAVPLYRVDYDAPEEEKGSRRFPVRRLLFSDGGLSSNFPIHFFDSLLPTRPTFGISLDEYDPARPDRRAHLPMPANDGRWIAIGHITKLPQFVMALLNAAKDWQDQLRTQLSGYRERVVHVYLDDKEGGMNLNMPAEVIAHLVDYGERAGHLLVGTPRDGDAFPFDFQDHQWRRFLLAYATLEEALGGAAESWGAGFGAEIAKRAANPQSYGASKAEDREEVVRRMQALMDLAAQWRQDPLVGRKNLFPAGRARLTITPEY